jgi:hypothetical protein
MKKNWIENSNSENML